MGIYISKFLGTGSIGSSRSPPIFGWFPGTKEPGTGTRNQGGTELEPHQKAPDQQEPKEPVPGHLLTRRKATIMARFPNIPAELGALVDITLTGAACAGHAPLFDERRKGESWADAEDRHDQARAICHRCPVQHQCAQALLDLPLGQRAGIWAGVDATQVTTTITEEKAA